ncbi:hypothetical protein NO995_00850 [Aestuariibaculum sp. M13]|uniref:hypothetical protein n=1 Tax=Aestuariibaculum sp. M13 TaxID=2967132 RepID=UPI002159D808|nr:hypothetical protein [Aestuariibaculum sp. M13]MCR8666219.1 hypothetical protein [Aestuariibaculum sp. M13]
MKNLSSVSKSLVVACFIVLSGIVSAQNLKKATLKNSYGTIVRSDSEGDKTDFGVFEFFDNSIYRGENPFLEGMNTGWLSHTNNSQILQYGVFSKDYFVGVKYFKSTNTVYRGVSNIKNVNSNDQHVFTSIKDIGTEPIKGNYTIIYKNEDLYAGEVFKGMRNGYGTYITKDGYVYKGRWVDDKRVDYEGTAVLEDAKVFRGVWEKDKIQGRGTIYNVQHVVSGVWEQKGRGLFNEYNTKVIDDKYLSENLETKIAYLINNDFLYKTNTNQEQKANKEIIDQNRELNNETDQQHISDKLNEVRFAQGRYVGDLENEIFNGQGTIYYTNGDKFEGVLIDGMFSSGTYSFQNGIKANGVFYKAYNNLLVFEGTLEYPNNVDYHGKVILTVSLSQKTSQTPLHIENFNSIHEDINKARIQIVNGILIERPVTTVSPEQKEANSTSNVNTKPRGNNEKDPFDKIWLFIIGGVVLYWVFSKIKITNILAGSADNKTQTAHTNKTSNYSTSSQNEIQREKVNVVRECKYCNKMFSTNESLSRHETLCKLNQKATKPKPKLKKYRCQCNQEFKSEMRLIMHQKDCPVVKERAAYKTKNNNSNSSHTVNSNDKQPASTSSNNITNKGGKSTVEKNKTSFKETNSVSQIKKVNYHALGLMESTSQYPIIRKPRYGNVIRSYRKGRNNRKGYKEEEFFSVLKQYFSDYFEVLDDIILAVGEGVNPYEPDIAMISKGTKNIHLDIEIDEPYAGVSRKLTHCYPEDMARDNFFVERGWLVVRFTEYQVHHQIMECLNFIAKLISKIDNSIEINELFSYEQVKREPCWNLNKAGVWESINYRENYLDHIFKPYTESYQYVNTALTDKEKSEEKLVIPQSNKQNENEVTPSQSTSYTQRNVPKPIKNYVKKVEVLNSNYKSINELIELAVKNNYDIKMIYTNYDGEVRERKVSDLEYSSEFMDNGYIYKEHFKGYCHYRKKERSFKVSRIEFIEIIK